MGISKLLWWFDIKRYGCVASSCSRPRTCIVIPHTQSTPRAQERTSSAARSACGSKKERKITGPPQKIVRRATAIRRKARKIRENFDKKNSQGRRTVDIIVFLFGFRQRG